MARSHRKQNMINAGNIRKSGCSEALEKANIDFTQEDELVGTWTRDVDVMDFRRCANFGLIFF